MEVTPKFKFTNNLSLNQIDFNVVRTICGVV